jgi:mRNA-degrading endonuclease toxin of MazEF toxin-antitoxin module
MSFQQWDIVQVEFSKRGAHPAVIISPNAIAAGSEVVNVLYCTSQRQSRLPKIMEVLLDQEDGLDWETFVYCDVIFSFRRDQLKARPQPGSVSKERRRQIRRKLVDIFGLLAE